MAEKTIELLSPAGDMERLRMSLAYGADAVYLAGPDFGMRSFAGNFTPEELRQAVELCHSRGVAVHVTCNTMPRNDEAARLPEWLEFLQAAGVDAAILADVAMRDASDLAREVADITLLSSDLRELAALRRLSQRMLERINRNYRSILTINTSLLALGIFGILPPTTTALLHNASTMAISAASMRPYLPAPGGRGAQGKEPGNETA